MKNSIKIALVAIVACVTISACENLGGAKADSKNIDTLETAPDKTATDTTGKADSLKKDSVKIDSVKK